MPASNSDHPATHMRARSHSFPRRSSRNDDDSLTDISERATAAARKSCKRICAAKQSRTEANAAWEPVKFGPVNRPDLLDQVEVDVATSEEDGASVMTRTQRLGLELPIRTRVAPLNARDLDGNLAEGELIKVVVMEATPTEAEPTDAADVSCVECAPVSANQKHFRCGVCLQNKWHSLDSSLALPCCGVEYCGDCWGQMLSVALQSGNPLSCPSIACRKSAAARAQRPRGPNPNQPSPVSSNLLKGLKQLAAVKNEQVDELRELYELLKKPNTRRCPSCNLPQLAPMSASQSHVGQPEMTCKRCDTEFCFRHGDAHPGESCDDYVRKTRNTVDVAFARKMHTKRCPNCLRSVWKSGGCNHMTCVCGSHWSWSAQPVEVPCHCLNLKTDGGKLQPWGCLPCKGASPIAHAKLAIWRSGVVAVSTPIVVSVAAVVLPVLAAKAQC